MTASDIMTSMDSTRRFAALGVIGMLTISLAACGEDDLEPEPTATVGLTEPGSTPATSAPPAPEENGDDGAADFRVGQPADKGSFDPLVIPEGMAYGDDLVLEESWLTGNGMPEVGEWGVAYTPNASTSSDYRPTFLFSVDEVTEPFTGSDYDAVYKALGASNGLASHGAPIQQITYRIREVGTNGGDRATFDLRAVLRALTLTGEESHFSTFEEPVLGCAGERNPFLDHGWETADTVQGCGYVITPVTAREQSAAFYGLQTLGKLADGETDQFTIYRSDKLPEDTGAGHDDYGHEEATDEDGNPLDGDH